MIAFDIRKTYETFVLDVSFRSDSKRIGILGASGSGKSQTLRAIAGIMKPDTGYIEIDGHVMYDSDAGIFVGPQARKVGYLFQSYALFPHMTVAENILAGLSGRSEGERRAVLRDMLAKFRIEGLEGKRPGEISGGQQQRVALARILAYAPRVILLDEPFSALDSFLKERVVQEVLGYLVDYGGTVITVSHSVTELQRFCEDVFLIENGRTEASGKAADICAAPPTAAAARLIGVENISSFVRHDACHGTATDWKLPIEVTASFPDESKFVGIRAENVRVRRTADGYANACPVRIRSVTDSNAHRHYAVSPDGTDVLVLVRTERGGVDASLCEGGAAYLCVKAEDMMFFSM